MQLLPVINTPQNKVFQCFLTMLGQMVHAVLLKN